VTGVRITEPDLINKRDLERENTGGIERR